MNRGQMKDRCPGAVFIDSGILVNYKFIINTRGVATVIKKISSKVYGILWEITSEDEEILDNYEGVQYGTYYKKFLNLKTSEKGSLSALVYIATDTNIGYTRAAKYMEAILTSAKDHELPKSYIKELEPWLKVDKEPS